MEDNRINILKYKMEYYYGQPIEPRDKGTKYLLTIPFPLDEEQIKVILMIIKEMWHTYTPALSSYELAALDPRTEEDY